MCVYIYIHIYIYIYIYIASCLYTPSVMKDIPPPRFSLPESSV